MRRTPASGVPVEFADFDEPVTGVISGEELRAARAKRPTDERIGRLEDKHDSLAEKVSTVSETVARIDGKLDTALAHLVRAATEAHQTDRARIDSRTRVVVATVGAICTLIGVVVTAVLAGCL